jgi:hypothetical protein
MQGCDREDDQQGTVLVGYCWHRLTGVVILCFSISLESDTLSDW